MSKVLTPVNLEAKMPVQKELSVEEQGVVVAVVRSCVRLVSSASPREDAAKMYQNVLSELRKTGNVATGLAYATSSALPIVQQTLCSGNCSMRQLQDCFTGPAEKISDLLSSKSAEFFLSYEFWLVVDLLRSMKDAQAVAVEYIAAERLSTFTLIPSCFVNPVLQSLLTNSTDITESIEITELHKMLLLVATIAYVMLPLIYKVGQNTVNLAIVEQELKGELLEELSQAKLSDSAHVSGAASICGERVEKNRAEGEAHKRKQTSSLERNGKYQQPNSPSKFDGLYRPPPNIVRVGRLGKLY